MTLSDLCEKREPVDSIVQLPANQVDMGDPLPTRGGGSHLYLALLFCAQRKGLN